uniref:Uncharacterized protein n=1 Tax=Picea sitchensis TaxID=3332 RepID=D5AC20_PICSI|nr:unknown [Picea sitchensis]
MRSKRSPIHNNVVVSIAMKPLICSLKFACVRCTIFCCCSCGESNCTQDPAYCT